MCLGIPAQVIEMISDDFQLATVEITGVRRAVSVNLVADQGVAPGDWVLVHVGFALTKLDEEEAARAIAELKQMGRSFTDELAAFAESSPR